MVYLLLSLIAGSQLTHSQLRTLVRMGYSGIAHEYADHKALHYGDHEWDSQCDFYAARGKRFNGS